MDIISQLQEQVNTIAGLAFNTFGTLQRDAHPVRLSSNYPELPANPTEDATANLAEQPKLMSADLVKAAKQKMGKETKSSIVMENIPMISRITDHKLTGPNYSGWSKSIRIYLRSISKDDHLSDDPPMDKEVNKEWVRDDARLFLQIRNSIDHEVVSLINHCEYVKELMDYLDFLYSGKGNIARIYDVCQGFYRAEQRDQSLQAYFMNFKKTYEELNELMPFSPDIKVQQTQREQMAIMSFLAGLGSQFESTKSQVLSSTELTSLVEVFSRVLRTDNQKRKVSSTPQAHNAFVGHSRGACSSRPYGRGTSRGGGRGSNLDRWSNRN